MILDRTSLLRHGWLAIMLTLSSATTLAAEEPTEPETVATRVRPEVDPLGVSAGGFLIYPKLTFSYLHDDNVLANQGSGKVASFATETSPEVSAHSNWSGNALNMLASASLVRFADFPNENYDDWLISADGRLDVTHDIKLAGGGSVGHNHISRTSADNSNTLEPITYSENTAFARYTHRLGRFRFTLDTTVTRQNYDNAFNLVGGALVLVSEDDRDHTETRTGLRAGYEAIPGQVFFVQLTQDNRDYSQPVAIANVERSSDGREALLGLSFVPGEIIFGTVSAGYSRRNYLAPFPDINTPVYAASVHWNITRLTTANLIAQRTTNDAQTPWFSGYVSTNTLFSIDHELRRHVLLNVSLNRIDDDYQAIAPAERRDTTYDIFMGPTYMINRNFYVSAQYHRLERNSTDNTLAPGVSNDYRKNIILVKLQAQL